MIAPLPLPPVAPIAPTAPIAPVAPIAPAPAPSALAQRQSLIARPHTVLGVCEGVGEDLGFNPLWLRIAFASGIFFAPLFVVGLYLALGLVVAGSRWAFPVVAAATPPATAAPALEQQPEQEYRIAA